VITDEWMLRFYGSYLAPASLTWMTYAKTLMRVPLAVIGQAVGIASFPYLAKLYSEGKFDQLNRTLNATLKGLILFLVPISALTIVLNRPVVFAVFSHTRLHPQDFQATAAALVVFSIGLFAWGTQNLVARGFYAAHDTLTPAVAGTVFTVLNIPIYWFCAKHWNYLGLAAASSWGVIAYTVFLFALLVRRTRNKEVGDLLQFLCKVSFASALSGFICFHLTSWLEARLIWQTTLGAFETIAIVGAVGFALTMIFSRLFGVVEIESYWRRIFPGNLKPPFAVVD
jgi:putative peptidoglycan lipid II flippase